MKSLSKRNENPESAFTLIELLVVIAIIGLLAALTSGLIAGAKSRSIESRTVAELELLVTMIEDYRSKMGYYPPDNIVNTQTGAVNPFVNPLYYELSGMLTDNDNNVWIYPDSRSETLTPAVVGNVFNIDGFANVAEKEVDLVYQPPRIKSSMIGNLLDSSIGVDLKVLQVPVFWREHDHADDGDDFHSPLVNDKNPLGEGVKLNTWRYVSSNATNNIGRFDLWAEISVGDEVKIIGNWQETGVEK